MCVEMLYEMQKGGKEKSCPPAELKFVDYF
jgi:hypothetical protein